jgi:hypothetical protein
MEYKILTKAGSCRSGHDSTGKIAHAVVNGKALCGNSPKGRSAGWSSWESDKVTCPKCLKSLTNTTKMLTV